MTRSGTDTTFRAVLYSGFLVKREEFSSVDASSVMASHISTGVRAMLEVEVLSSPLYACSNSGSDGRFDMLDIYSQIWNRMFYASWR